MSTISHVTGVSREDIHDGTDLFSLGLDSLGVMRLVNECRVHGLLRANPHLAA